MIKQGEINADTEFFDGGMIEPVLCKKIIRTVSGESVRIIRYLYLSLF